MQIGERIAAYRKRRGMSQEALAGLVGMSRSWLSQVERGIHTVDRLSTLTDLAAVLRVDVADLVGREWRLAPNGGSHVAAIDAIGRQLADYSHLVWRTASAVATAATQKCCGRDSPRLPGCAL